MRWLEGINIHRSFRAPMLPAHQDPSPIRRTDDYVGLLFSDPDGQLRREIQTSLTRGPVFAVTPGLETDRLLKALGLCRAIADRS
jgi:hypothetical protein